MSRDRVPFSTHGFSVVVVRNSEGKWLAVKETRNRGWWLPAGLVQQGETFFQAALRECQEEARINVILKGILRVEHSVYGPTHARMRVIFFGVPEDESQPLKRVADKESEEARWATLEELKKLARISPGLRGPELYEWGSYIEKGGMVAPLHFLCREDEHMPQPQGLNSASEKPSDLKTILEAIERGDEEKLKSAVLSGGNLSCVLNDQDWRPLHLACKLNQEECVKILLLGGASISVRTKTNKNVIHFAAQSTPATLRNVLIASCMLENRVELLNHQDEEGNTPLHLAAKAYGRGVVWEMLVENGADPDIYNNNYFTANDIADKTFVVS